MKKQLLGPIYKVEYKRHQGGTHMVYIELTPFGKNSNGEKLTEMLFDKIHRYKGNHADGHGTFEAKCTLMVESNEIINIDNREHIRSVHEQTIASSDEG